MVFSALALSQCEVIWYFQHVGVAASKSTRVKTVDIVSYSDVIFFLGFNKSLFQYSIDF